VVLKNGVQLLDVLRLQQTVQSGLGELGEGLVGRGEHGEGALGLQSSDQFAFSEGSDEGRQVFRAGGEFDDALGGWAFDLRRKQHRVDDVHHAVSGLDVGGSHLGLAIDVDTAPALCDRQ